MLSLENFKALFKHDYDTWVSHPYAIKSRSEYFIEFQKITTIFQQHLIDGKFKSQKMQYSINIACHDKTMQLRIIRNIFLKIHQTANVFCFDLQDNKRFNLRFFIDSDLMGIQLLQEETIATNQLTFCSII